MIVIMIMSNNSGFLNEKFLQDGLQHASHLEIDEIYFHT